MLYPEISESIIGAAMTVLNELKPGLDEKLYENALVIELDHERASVRTTTAVSGVLQVTEDRQTDPRSHH